jgi:hypothetical protein
MTLKQKWDTLLEYSLALAAGTVMILSAVGLLMVVGIAVVISKVLVFIK